jgi:hypothetical protein
MAAITGLGDVQPVARAAAEEIAAKFGITNIGGKATSGHITNSDHYTGLAIDVMTLSSGKGPMIAEYALTNAQRLHVKYVIHNRRIYDVRDGKGWQPYHGTSPHTDHVHISFFATGGNETYKMSGNDQLGAPAAVDAAGCLNLVRQLVGA